MYSSVHKFWAHKSLVIKFNNVLKLHNIPLKQLFFIQNPYYDDKVKKNNKDHIYRSLRMVQIDKIIELIISSY